MREGEFFQIPEMPRDVDLMRRQAVPLDDDSRPAWLDDDYYCLAICKTSAGLSNDARKRFLTEVEELRTSGLVVDQDAGDPDIWRVYVPAASEYDVWSIGIYEGPSPLGLSPAAGVENPVLTRDDISDVPAVFVADPFIIRRERGWFMFFEVLNWRANKGEIGLATSEDGLRWRYEQRVLIEPFHLSYPYVFDYGGECYMIPETRQSGAVRLYQASDFPTGWSFVATLLDGDHLVDPSVFRASDRWWMFAGDASSGKHDTLRLYGADSLTGPWHQHASSPVVTGDARIARPAGRVVVHDSGVLRFAQNCQEAYGVDVRVFEITELTMETYREAAVGPDPLVGPGGAGWAAGGMHHVDVCRRDDGSWLACVDGWTSSDAQTR